MKFYSIVSSISYEITPADYEYNGPNLRNRRLVPGITARFSNHTYDTKLEQQQKKWSDETREMVEYYLVNHENYNTQWLQSMPESEAEAKAKEFTEAGICISRTVTDEGIVDCDQPALEGGFYCQRHEPSMESARS